MVCYSTPKQYSAAGDFTLSGGSSKKRKREESEDDDLQQNGGEFVPPITKY